MQKFHVRTDFSWTGKAANHEDAKVKGRTALKAKVPEAIIDPMTITSFDLGILTDGHPDHVGSYCVDMDIQFHIESTKENLSQDLYVLLSSVESEEAGDNFGNAQTLIDGEDPNDWTVEDGD